MTHKLIYPEPISKMLLIFGILTDHIATSQIDWWLHGSNKNTKKNKNYLEIGSKCATFYVSNIYVSQSIFPIFLITLLNSDIGLLHLTKLGNLFQINDPRKCTELVPWILDLAGGMKSTGPRLKLYGTSLYLKYNHINWEFQVPVLLYISINKNPKCHWWSS